MTLSLKENGYLLTKFSLHGRAVGTEKTEVRMHPKILANQLNLFQSEGAT